MEEPREVERASEIGVEIQPFREEVGVACGRV